MKFLLSLLFLCCIHTITAQQVHNIDVKKGTADIVIRPQLGEVGVDVTYEFEILQDVDSLYIDAGYIYHYEVYDKTFKGTHNYDKNRITFKNSFKKGAKHVVKIACFSRPKKAMYFIGWEDKNAPVKQIWTQGQGKETSNWLPSFNDVNEKIEFDLSITFDKRYEVITNGELVKKEEPNDSLTKWYYNMKQPMSSYLVALAIGKYHKKRETAKSGIPIDLYYYPKDSAKFEPTYRYSKRMFDFLEEEIGVAYPWQNYKQIPVHDFLYAGMENTSATIFSDAFVVDSIGFVDKNYVNVNAHELAHQWFGNLVTAKSSKHHWLQEGFATYYALLVEKEIFGDHYFYWKLYQSAMQLRDVNNGKGEAVLNPKASSLTFYQKGAWALHVLRQKVGVEAFKKAVQRYLETYKYKNVTTQDFIAIVAEESKQDLSEFVTTWLVNPQLPENFYNPKSMRMPREIPENMFSYLGGGIGEVFNFASIEKTDSGFNYSLVKQSLAMFTKKPMQEVLPISETYIANSIKKLQIKDTVATTEIYKQAFKTGNIKIRQAIANSVRKIPLALKEDFETLLDDASYSTQEVALFVLWNNFPESQHKYLNKLKEVDGFNTKNIRLLWLTLALLTDDYESENDQRYYVELLNYTTTKYNFEVRQNAFEYLLWIRSCGSECQENLKKATKHHNWRLVKFAKKQLKYLENN